MTAAKVTIGNDTLITLGSVTRYGALVPMAGQTLKFSTPICYLNTILMQVLIHDGLLSRYD